jgi:hypothetical protein
MSVATRRFDEEPTLLTSLRNPVTKLAWSKISSPPHAIDTIKALLLLCSWPFPVESEISDMTPVFISIAIQAARKLGMHDPPNSQDFLGYKFQPSQEEMQDMIKIWSACNVVAHRYLIPRIKMQKMLLNMKYQLFHEFWSAVIIRTGLDN